MKKENLKAMLSQAKRARNSAEGVIRETERAIGMIDRVTLTQQQVDELLAPIQERSDEAITKSADLKVVTDSTKELGANLDPLVAVPNIAGMTQADALSALAAAGISVYQGAVVYDPLVPAGTVIDQDITPGTMIPTDRQLKYRVSDGPQPEILDEV